MAGENTVRAERDIVEEFAVEGIVVLEQIFSKSYCDAAVQKMRKLPALVESHLGEAWRDARRRGELELRLPFLYDDFFLELLEHPTVIEMLDRFLPPPSILRYQNVEFHEPENKRGPLRSNAHFHWNYQRRIEPLCLLDIVAVFDGSAETGFEIMPRSQKMDERPDLSRASCLSLPSGSLTVMNPYLWHRECDNDGEVPRMYVHMQFSRPFIKPHFDAVRVLGEERIRKLSPRLQQLLGLNARLPSSLEEFYVAPEARLYKSDQW